MERNAGGEIEYPMNKPRLSFARRLVLSAVLGIGLWSVARVAVFGVVLDDWPTGRSRDQLGDGVGELSSRWVAPYVFDIEGGVTRWEIFDEVRWYNPDGTLKRTVANAYDPGRPVNSGYVVARQGDSFTVYSTLASWSMQLPEGFGPWGASWDGKTFVSMWMSKDYEKFTTDVYLEGNLVATLGPYRSVAGGGYFLGEDGSLAIGVGVELPAPAGSTATVTPAPKVRVLAFGPGMKKTFESEFDYLVQGASSAPASQGIEGTTTNEFLRRVVSVAPGGQGVVVQVAKDSQYAYLTKDGLGKPLQVRGTLKCWVPNSTRALYWAAGDPQGQQEYALVDWAKGTILWDVKESKEFSDGFKVVDATIAGDYVLLSGLETSEAHRRYQALYAMDLGNGKLVREGSLGYMSGDVEAHFMPVGGQLYLVSSKGYAPLHIEDVKSKGNMNGWGDVPGWFEAPSK